MNRDSIKNIVAERAKTAGWFSDQLNKNMGGMPRKARIKELALGALVLGGVGAALSAGGSLADSAIDAIKDPIKKHFGYKRMMEKNPWLKKEKEETVKDYYNTLNNFSPSVAQDPLAAGSFMRKQLEFKDVGIQPNDVETLSKIEKSVRDRKSDRFLFDAFRSGGDKIIGTLG